MSSSGLPIGWVELFDTNSKRYYYAHPSSNKVQWDFPIEVSSASSVPTTPTKLKMGFDYDPLSLSPLGKAEKVIDCAPTPLSSSPDMLQKAEAVKPIIYLHLSDPFSLKLLIWLSETKLVNKMKIEVVSDDNEALIIEEYVASRAERMNVDSIAISRRLLYPTTLLRDGEILTGVDRTIHFFKSEYIGSSDSEWLDLHAFNFFSKGLLPEFGNMMGDRSRGCTRTEEEYLKLYEENIHLQSYMTGDTIHRFRAEYVLRQENKKLRHENEQMSSRLMDMTQRISTERVGGYSKTADIRKLKEDIESLSQEREKEKEREMEMQKSHRGQVASLDQRISHLTRVTNEWEQCARQISGQLSHSKEGDVSREGRIGPNDLCRFFE
jgi:hypothetical protein